MPPAYGPLRERPFVRENGAAEKGAGENGAWGKTGAGGAATGVGRGNGAGRSDSNGHVSGAAGPQPRQLIRSRTSDSVRRGLEKLRAQVIKPRVKAEPERTIPASTDWNPNGRELSPAPAPAPSPAGAVPTAVQSPGVESVSVRAVSGVADGANRPVLAHDESPGPSDRVVTHLDVYSVAKVSIVFYLILLVVFVVASVLLWLVADAFGAVDSIQRSIKSLFDVKSYVLHPATIALYTSAFGAVLAVAGTIANVLAAVIYNLISEVVGGIRIGVSTAEDAGGPAATPAGVSRRRRGPGVGPPRTGR